MKKNVKLPVMAAALAIALTGPVMANTTYPDVMEGKWYTTAIENAVSNGLLNGYEDGTMKPNASITRAEIAAVLTKAFGAKENTSLSRFYDVSTNQWFYDAMSKAVKMEIFTGDDKGCLNPKNAITRQEAASVIARAFELTHSGNDVLSRFADKSSVSAWAVPYVSALVENGYMAGNDAGLLNPKGNITRAEFAQIMSNITNDYVVDRGNVENDFDGSVVVRVADVVMKDLTVDGNLVVADGVGRGDFTLDNVTVNGNLVIRGGGINSIVLKNGAKINGKVVTRNHSGKTRIEADESSEISNLVVNTDVIIEGNVENVSVDSSADVQVKGNVETIDVNAENVNITGTGKVENVNANANNTDVDVKGANVTAASGVTGVTAGSVTVDGGSSEVVSGATSGGAGGGSASSGSGNSSSTVKLAYTIELDNGVYVVKADKSSNGNITDFDKEYEITIRGLVEVSKASVKSASDAVSLAMTVISDENIDMATLMDTIDAKHINDGSDAYKAYRSKLKAAMAMLEGEDPETYQRILNAKNMALEGGKAEEDVTLAEVFKNYETANGKGSAKATVVDLLDKLSEQSFYSDLLIYFIVEEGFGDSLVTDVI